MNKFKEIIEAQEGKVPSIDELEKKLGKFRKDLISSANVTIKEIDNKKINLIASIAGCPMDKGSGIYLHKQVGEKIKKGEKLLTVYSDSQARIDNAIEMLDKLEPVSY